ncbi:MAG: hypothetical protein ACLUDD_04955 [Lactobacillus kalixensis]|uniref:hypothetical protein n=1 Tax=Lactobacillus kalixensis TaxID=227944 RepID=UPI003995E843
MVRYVSLNEFMHDFAAGATAQIPWDKTTTTYQRAVRREQRRITDFYKNFGKTTAADRAKQKKFAQDDQRKAKIFNSVVNRVQKQHPELSHIKARNYARTKDPVGKKVFSLIHNGSSLKQIRSAVKASTGRSGN